MTRSVAAPFLATALLLTASLCHGEPAAWQVRSSDGGELWLLGSVHYLRESDYPLPETVDRLYLHSESLVMEIDLDDLNVPVVQAAFAQAGTLASGRTLRDVLDPGLYSDTEAYAADLGLDLAAIAGFEPWLVALTLMDLGMGTLGFRADLGLEQELLLRAVDDGKEILGLESIDDQIRIFDGLPEAAQADLLAQTLVELIEAQVVMDELIEAWRDGSLDLLASRLAADFEEFPELQRAIVDDRNRAWLTTLRELLEEETRYLVVVGALHLVGEESVVELLRQEGYTVTLANP